MKFSFLLAYGTLFAIICFGYILGTFFARKFFVKIHINKLISIAILIFFSGSTLMFIFAGYIAGAFQARSQLPLASVMFMSSVFLVISTYILILKNIKPIGFQN
jgi:hypothetical protein